MRIPYDKYYTGDILISALYNNVKINGSIFEPCAGKGAISNYLKNKGLNVITNDLIPSIVTDYKMDASKNEVWNEINALWIITNPPFNKALDILEQALIKNKPTAFLLRLSFLEPTYDRQNFLFSNPPSKLIVLPRYSFSGRGNDSVTRAWMLWNYIDDKPIVIVKKG